MRAREPGRIPIRTKRRMGTTGSSSPAPCVPQRRRATRRDVRRATLRDANISWLLSSWVSGLRRLATGFGGVQLLRLLLRHETDLDEVERADEAVAEAEAARAGDRVAERHRPVVLEQD